MHSLRRDGVGPGVDGWEHGAIGVQRNEPHCRDSRHAVELWTPGVRVLVHGLGQHDLNLCSIENRACNTHDRQRWDTLELVEFVQNL